MRITEPGIFKATEAEYHADPCPEPSLSSSLAKEIVNKTPIHAWTASQRLNPDFEPVNKTVFDVGTAAHTVYTGTGAAIRVIDAEAFTTKASREERDAAYERGLTPLLASQWERVQDMVAAGRVQLRAHDCGDVFDGGECEVNFAAIVGGVWSRCRVDCLDREHRIVYDLKTTGENPAPEAFARTMANLSYDIQAAHYVDTVEAVLGKGWRFRLIVQEKAPPHLLSVIELSPEWIALGRRKIARARELWRRCLDTGQWPGFPAVVAVVEAPGWHEGKWTEREINEAQIQRQTGRDALDMAFKFQAPLDVVA